MKTTITHQYQISLPEALLAGAGLREGDALDCRVYEGAICLLPEGAGGLWEGRLATEGKKKIRPGRGAGRPCRRKMGDELLWGLLPVRRRALFFYQKPEGGGAFGPAGL